MASAEQGPELNRPTTASKFLEADVKSWAKMTKELYDTSPRPPIAPLDDRDVWDVSKYKNKPKLAPAEASQKCADAIEKYDAEECRAYREEIDTLLVFVRHIMLRLFWAVVSHSLAIKAGLFSAVVTAFTVESYKWLQDDPDDVIIALLAQIAHQPPRAKTGFPDAASSRINAYWFLSLALSLSAALVSILCKQWIREFERHTGLSDAMQFIAIRHMKLQGFESWRVSGVVAAIPLLLQSALGLFAVGAIELLWNLHRTVAIVALVPAGAALVFYALTTSLTTIQAISSPFGLLRTLPQCPFKSPQAMLALRLVVLLRLMGRWFHHGWLALWRFPIRCSSAAMRKCRVFLRRVRAWRKPELFPEVWRDIQPVPNSWGRLLFIWNYPECCLHERDLYWSSYDPGRLASDGIEDPYTGWDASSSDAEPRPTRPFWKSMCSFLSLWPRPARRTPDFPTLNHTKSWIQVDRAFTDFRDHAYTGDEFERALKLDKASIAPRLFFGGLMWLRDHVHAVDIESWIFLSIWDHIDFQQRSLNGFLDAHIRYGIRTALPAEWTKTRSFTTFTAPLDTSTVREVVLLYAQHAKLEPAFIAEALAHQLPCMEDEDACTVLRYFSRGGSELHEMAYYSDHGCWLWILDSVLRLQLMRSSIDWEYRLASPLLEYVPIPEAVSTQTLACLVALRLPYLHRAGQVSHQSRAAYEARSNLYTLLRLSIARLVDPESDWHLPGMALELSSTVFEALALVVDQRLLQQLHEGGFTGEDDACAAAALLRPECQSVYLRLLSAALGSPAVAADHIDQLIVANREGVAYQFGLPAHTPVPASTPSQQPGSSALPGKNAEVDPTAQVREGESAGVDPITAPESEGLTRAEADLASQSLDRASELREVGPSAQDSAIPDRAVELP